KQNLENWALSHYHFKDEPIILRGHTDEDADSKYNMDLSARRNRAVYTLLKMQGFSDITYKDFGESWPLCQENNEVCMAQNRRVEVLLLEDIDEKWAENISTTAPQVQFIDPAENHVVKGKEGTKVIVPKNGFIHEDGSEALQVRVEIREYYSVATCLKNKISTMCGDKILESGGMIEVKAFDENDRELKISGENSPKISFKNEAEKQEGMQLFYGVVENGVMNWSETPAENKVASISTICGTRGNFIYADQGSIVSIYDKRTGWLSIAVNARNRKEFNRIRQKMDKDRTLDDIEKLKKWDEETKQIEIMNLAELDRMIQIKIKEDSIALAKQMKPLTKEEKKLFDEKQKRSADFLNANARIQSSFMLKGTGFINCDRYLKINTQVPTQFYCTREIEGAQFFVYVKNINSVLILNSNRSLFQSVSAGTTLQEDLEIEVIMVANSKEGMLFEKKSGIVTSTNNKWEFEGQPTTLEEIDKLFMTYQQDV
ncbi:MAG: OmpA family protein, partial [Flavobacteriales bacterium]